MTEPRALVRITRTRLADGRALTYYDDREPYVSGAATRTLDDPRDLSPSQALPTMRLDVLTGEWVVLAPHRMGRTHLPGTRGCPLCPSRDGAMTEIPARDYDVVVFDNRFPALGSPLHAAAAAVPPLVDGDPLWPQRQAIGRCEVVCFTSEHDSSCAGLTPSRAATVIEAWADRTRALSGADGVRQVFCFENRGAETGVTLHHPHGQIYAYPFVPPRTERLLARAAAHRDSTGADLLSDLLAAELRAGTRIVHRGAAWTAYVPAAARWPVEVHLVPHRAVPDLAALDSAERRELATLYPALLRRVDGFFADQGDPGPVPYVAGWHQAPVGPGRHLTRLHLQLFSVRRAAGKLKYLAGSESGVGVWLNDTTPERIAHRLRELT
ncbi:MAG: galactose-1-phosphate uridylyltransferase [Pseudonocardiales bacterium]|nr:galactose-1-phosphate uridylyltransferase [Pseudonocardiales bacterium]MBV9028817.1 galactose-1-phosphate uridylyltransferase [Pseudonocardiales bacterium]MBW0010492.1 galactose-1-phosphate uridylyltransferase [Pseudonocardiales bacterium]